MDSSERLTSQRYFQLQDFKGSTKDSDLMKKFSRRKSNRTSVKSSACKKTNGDEKNNPGLKRNLSNNSKRKNSKLNEHRRKYLEQNIDFSKKFSKSTTRKERNNQRSLLNEDENELEALVFGGKTNVIECQASDELKIENSKKMLSLEECKEKNLEGETISPSINRRPIWEDEDDAQILVKDKAETYSKSTKVVVAKADIKYADYVRTQLLKVVGTPRWAKLEKNEEHLEVDSDDDRILKSTGDLLEKSESLLQKTLNISKCHNLNSQAKDFNIVKSTEFHPSSQVALVAGLNGTASIFQVDGKINAKIQSIHFEKFPIHCAHFTLDGEQIIVGSKECKYFYYYDMITGKIVKASLDRAMNQSNTRHFVLSPDGKLIVLYGKYGHIHLFTAKSKEWITTLKMNGEVTAVTFNRDGSRMFSHGDKGQVYIWDMISRQCVHKFSDEGCLQGTSVELSPNGQYLATGSDMGIVNIYDSSSVINDSHPKPSKVILNLTTEISCLKFNSTSEILAVSSSFKDNAVKLIHFPSMIPFSNFPVFSLNMKRIQCLDFSVNSGFMCLGNNVGTAYLFRYHDYQNY